MNAGDTWTLEFTCGRCNTVAVADSGDLCADEFKVSGYHFDGSAVCARRLYVHCPTCAKLHFLDSDTAATVPYLLNQRAEQNTRRIETSNTTGSDTNSGRTP